MSTEFLLFVWIVAIPLILVGWLAYHAWERDCQAYEEVCADEDDQDADVIEFPQ